MESLVIVYSYHHKNTEKIAKVMAEVLDAPIVTPQEVDIDEIHKFGLVGFGAGIDSGRHYKVLLDLVDKLPEVDNRNAFIFSTCTIHREVSKNHTTLREMLQSKGYIIVGEFGCPGFNTNSFARFFGGVNKGRPNAEDLKHAEEFAQNLLHVV
jgi:flavodoxin